MPLDREAAFFRINQNLEIAGNFESNITYWQIVLAALKEEKPLFEGDLESYRGKEKQINRRIRRNQKAYNKHIRRADKIIRKYTKQGGDIHG